MNKLFLILLFAIPNLIFCQIGTYNIALTDTVQPFGKGPNKTIIHQIKLNKNGTFEFRSPPENGCLTWREFKGTWTQKRSTLILTDSIRVQTKDIEFEHNNISDNRYYDLIFKVDSKKIFANKPIQITFIYDFESEIKNTVVNYNTDINGRINIPFDNITNLNFLSAFRIELMLENGEKRWDYFTTNNYVNRKEKDLPNTVIANIKSALLKKTVIRTTKASISGENLQIASSKSQKSKLSQLITPLAFGTSYKLSLINY